MHLSFNIFNCLCWDFGLIRVEKALDYISFLSYHNCKKLKQELSGLPTSSIYPITHVVSNLIDGLTLFLSYKIVVIERFFVHLLWLSDTISNGGENQVDYRRWRRGKREQHLGITPQQIASVEFWTKRLWQALYINSY